MNDIKGGSAEIIRIDTEIRTDAQRLADTIRELLAVSATSFKRASLAPVLAQDSHGKKERATWRGLKFSGQRRHSHKGQSGTWCWYITGSSYYVSLDGTVYSLDWDGEATDFDSDGYMDDFTSEIKVETLEDHLAKNPDSAEEIVAALREACESDLRARRTIRAEISAVIGRLAATA